NRTDVGSPDTRTCGVEREEIEPRTLARRGGRLGRNERGTIDSRAVPPRTGDGECAGRAGREGRRRRRGECAECFRSGAQCVECSTRRTYRSRDGGKDRARAA